MKKRPFHFSAHSQTFAAIGVIIGGLIAMAILEYRPLFPAQIASTSTSSSVSSHSASSSSTSSGPAAGFSAVSSSGSSVFSTSSSSSLFLFIPWITDVDWRSEEGSAVYFFMKHGIIQGYPDLTFRGSEFINRAEIAKIVLLTGRIPITHMANNGRFHDVAEDEWYTPYIATAAKKGIVTGYPPRHLLFALRNPINTAEFLKMLTLTFTLRERMRHGFRDIPDQAWYAPYVGVAWQYKLFDRGENLQADRPLSRREVLIALFRLFHQQKPRGVSAWFAPNISSLPIISLSSSSQSSSLSSSVPQLGTSASSSGST